MVVNFREQCNGKLFVVFMLPGNGFFRGTLKVQSRAKIGEVKRFYWAEIQFIDSDDKDALLEILALTMEDQAETSPPAF